jgi:hypothetical protein
LEIKYARDYSSYFDIGIKYKYKLYKNKKF